MLIVKNFFISLILLSLYTSSLFAKESTEIVLQLNPEQVYEMELAKLKAEKEYLHTLLSKNTRRATKKTQKRKRKKKTKHKRVSTLLVRIDLSQQKMRVSRGGKTLYVWPALTGRGYNPTPTGTFRPKFIRKRYRSEVCHREYMPHAIFLKNDLAIYGTRSIYKPTINLNHNCVRISPENAKKLFDLMRKYGKYRVIFRITR